jgi:hypothetical protein
MPTERKSERPRTLGIRVRAQARTHYVRSEGDPVSPDFTPRELGSVITVEGKPCRVVHESLAQRRDSKGRVFWFVVEGVVDAE